MAIIPQTSLFCWEDVENLGDLHRLRLVLESTPDEELMRALEARRGRGRDDYPVRAVWNSILAGIVYQHASIESLRRELLRNDRLRWMCGFDPVLPAQKAVPNPWNYTRFFAVLSAHVEMVDDIFRALVERLGTELPDFGRHLACDSKEVHTHARPRGLEWLREAERDGRREIDADFGRKTYRRRREDGTLEETVHRWFGYKLHLLVDADYELPVGYELTRASRADIRSGRRLVQELAGHHPALIQRAEVFTGDKGYDDTKLIEKLWSWEVAPIIPKREDWRGEPTRPLLEGADNVTYDCQGRIQCYPPGRAEPREMVYAGYDRGRDAQKWRCPAAVYAVECRGRGRCCSGSDYGRVVWVKREWDPRTFTPVARASLKFERLYKKRSAVERVNSRMGGGYGLDHHFIRGQAKMRLRCALALVTMLSLALGRVSENKEAALGGGERAPSLRSLVGTA